MKSGHKGGGDFDFFMPSSGLAISPVQGQQFSKHPLGVSGSPGIGLAGGSDEASLEAGEGGEGRAEEF